MTTLARRLARRFVRKEIKPIVPAPRDAGEHVKELLEPRIIAGGCVLALAAYEGPEHDRRAAEGYTLAAPPLAERELMQVHDLILAGKLEPVYGPTSVTRAVLKTVTLRPAPEPDPKPKWLLKRIERNRIRREAAR
jgi:hypothetical protein